MTNIEDITARKQALLARAETERNKIARTYYQWQARTHATRQVTRILKNPLVLAGIGLLALKMPWKRTYKFGGWAWKAWRLVRMVRRMWI
ncbi:MAG TPA: hypothetical protein VM735_05140 [Candidatus Kapabacteria bacterium]|jgi:hypothetical protein|nr:hypothetical protein [Candidatus Kapabacteria bacterium]